jgi:hypothetical protein
MTAKRIFLIVVVLCANTLWAQQTTPYIVTIFPQAVKAATDLDTIGWTGIARPSLPGQPAFVAPDSGTIYFDRSPGGSVVGNYHYSISKFYLQKQADGSSIYQNNIFIPGAIPQRKIVFKAADQPAMGYGLFYFIVALKTTVLGKDTTLVSNEMTMAIETPTPVTTIGPSDTISQLTPTFQWQANPGVPYYDIILSDEPLSISTDTTSGTSQVNVTGLSISWQAITPNTQIVYGTPDPSGMLTATAPPLSPGKTYFWVVLNTYANSPLYSSQKVGIPTTFMVKGVPLAKPKNISPVSVTLRSDVDSIVTFKWTHLDPKANTYQIYLYISSALQQVNAQMVVWSNTVTAGTFAGKNGVIDTTDTGFVAINAHSVLTKNHYTWKVFAIDSKGASTSGDSTGFDYTDPATGTMTFYTKEKLISTTTLPSGGDQKDTIMSVVGAVEMQVEVLSGSLEAPLLFYTDLNGYLNRERPKGSYRITAIKSGYNSLATTVQLDSGAQITDTFFLQRPDATVYGKVADITGNAIPQAAVYAVSDRNDTVSAQTDPTGSFVLNCYGATWSIWAKKTGYVTALPKQAAVTYGQNLSFGNITLALNPFSLSGTVVNENNSAIIGADVKVLNDGGQAVGELASTPQSGAFSFSVSPGAYTVQAAKIGFTSYSKKITVANSMQLSIVMPSGAAMITGDIIGATWVGASRVFAPITKATILFIDTSASPSDTFATISDATYGNFGLSVTSLKRFKSVASVNGFISKTEVLPDSTRPGSTLTYNDTLQSLGTVSGSVKVSGLGTAVPSATITLLNPQTGQIIASTASQTNGNFEIDNLVDGIFYIRAGAIGYFTDSIMATDTFSVSSGRAMVKGTPIAGSFTVFMSPGKKTVKWLVNKGSDTTATIKVKSPVQVNLAANQSLTNAGAGSYIIAASKAIVDTNDSIIDLSYHAFTVQNAETLHVDSIDLPVVNSTPKALDIKNDSVGVVLHATAPDTLDSVALFFRDINAPAFSSIVAKSRALSYSLGFRPPKDGSVLVYYFKAFRRADVYGYSNQTFTAYVNPDTSRLSKLELVPTSGDTILLGAKSQIQIQLQGYAGSTFSPKAIPPAAIRWKLAGAPRGTHFIDSLGAQSIIATGSDSSNAPVQLLAVIDTTVQPVAALLAPAPQTSLYFNVSSRPLASITVTRIDAGNPFPLSTSALSQAEFLAQGLDANNNILTITPYWSISPTQAGSVSSSGLFKPTVGFAGFVRIYAQTGGFTGEYNAVGTNDKQFGLEVDNIISVSGAADTVSNQIGCSIIFPDSALPTGTSGLLEIAVPQLKNQLELSSGPYTVVGSAYDITEKTGAIFRIRGADSIKAVLSIPASSTPGHKYCVGLWSPDSLQWQPLVNSSLSADGSMVSASIPHFSRYAVLTQSIGLSSTLSILPNPFSPEKSASDFPSLAQRLGMNAPKGTCISFTLDMQQQRLDNAKIRIYNIVGDQVCGVELQSPFKMTAYQLWWDGRTTDHIVDWGSLKALGQTAAVMSGNKMCRNGRYFVLLTIKDVTGKEKTYTKQVVLIK